MQPGKLNVIIHPASGSREAEQAAAGTMTLDTAEVFLRDMFSMKDVGGEISFSFRGPEPTLAGIGFYQAFAKLAARLASPDCCLRWSIHTDGRNLDEDWCRLFSKHGFEVFVQDPDRWGDGAQKRKIRSAIRKLARRDIVVNVQCELTEKSSRNPEALYQSLKKTGASGIVFRPDPADGPTNGQYGNFLCRVFEEWLEDLQGGSSLTVEPFRSYIRTLRGADARGRWDSVILLDADGGLYPWENAHRLGTAGETSLEALFTGPAYRQWQQGGDQKPQACLACRWNKLCAGRDWIADPQGTHHPYCSAYKRFFMCVYPSLLQVARGAKETS